MADTLDVCLGITGSFEGGNGQPRWDLLAGDEDDCGLSVGALQWNVASGTLTPLIRAVQDAYPDSTEFAEAYKLAGMPLEAALAFVRRHWINPATRKLTTQARGLWGALAATPECVAKQRELAGVILQRAELDAVNFMPAYPSLRVSSFMFDVHVQQGGLRKRLPSGKWVVPEVVIDPAQATSAQTAVALAEIQGHAKTAKAWQATMEQDPMAKILMHYAYQRAKLARKDYVWDALARRATIACRVGYVHGQWFDLTSVLP